MAKDSKMISAQASEQPPRGNGTSVSVDNMPGKTKGGKQAHEILNDKMAKGLGC